MFKTLANIVAAGLIAVGILSPNTATNNLGSSIPSSPALVDTYLSAPISTTDTSMTLAKGTTLDNQTLTGFQCFVLDINTPSVEYVCGTASSTSVTSLTRGINLMNPNATSSVNIHSHRAYASVQTTDYPTLQFIVRKLNGTDSFDSGLYYISSSASFVTSSTQLASKAYVDAYNSSSTFWTLSGSNMYSSLSGNVGIGTS